MDDAVEGGMAAFIVAWADCTTPMLDEWLAARLGRIAQAFGAYGAFTPQEREVLCRRTIQALTLYQSRIAPDAASSSPPPGPLRFLKGVGPKREAQLAQLGIRTPGDLLRHYPSRYEDRTRMKAAANLEHRESACLQVEVIGAGECRRRGKIAVAEVPAKDSSGEVKLVWFGQPYRASQFEAGTVLLVTGQAMIHKGAMSFHVSETEVIQRPGETAPEQAPEGIVPVYPLGAGLTQTFMRGLIRHALKACEPLPSGAVPERIAREHGLMDYPEALREVHAPSSEEARAKARERIVFEELFVLQAALAQRRRQHVQTRAGAVLPARELVERFVQSLPFPPTGAQSRVLNDVAADLEATAPACRLIHGDVGAGKTICAAFALLAAALGGRQGALLAPTELLAEQHFATLTQLLRPFEVSCALLTGSMGESARRYALGQIQRGDARVIVGTHAIFQEAVTYRDLAVAVVDEQHRFGVRQRAQLATKGLHPNLFFMSATPIPRTLALTAYGDFDVSVLDELPPGRTPVVTHLAWGKSRHAAYETVVGRLVQGAQAYVICPLVEEQEGEAASAEREFRRLSLGPFASFKLGLLHGRMDAERRDQVMTQFREGHLEILISTTVVEVGVDVPNATVMLIENAERFGLAQLHQLRGRVARGTQAGICILMTRASTPEVVDRLRVLERTTNGFEIAEEDLRRRGPGELAGTRQSGLPDLRMADLIGDTPALVRARTEAFAIIEADPDLALPEHQALRDALWGDGDGLAGWAL